MTKQKRERKKRVIEERKDYLLTYLLYLCLSVKSYLPPTDTAGRAVRPSKTAVLLLAAAYLPKTVLLYLPTDPRLRLCLSVRPSVHLLRPACWPVCPAGRLPTKDCDLYLCVADWRLSACPSDCVPRSWNLAGLCGACLSVRLPAYPSTTARTLLVRPSVFVCPRQNR